MACEHQLPSGEILRTVLDGNQRFATRPRPDEGTWSPEAPGDIGFHLVQAATQALATRRRVLDRLDYGGASLLGECGAPGFSLIKGDVNDASCCAAERKEPT